MRNRLVAMKVAHGVRSVTFVDTIALTCMQIVSRVAALKNVRGRRRRELALYDVNVAILHKRQRMSKLECSWKRTQKGVLTEAGYAALKVCHPVYHCFETDSMAASQDGRRVLLRKIVKKGYSG